MLFVFLLQVSNTYGGDHAVTKSREAYRMGARHYHARDYEAALLDFRAALRWRPSHPALIYTVAALEAKTGDRETTSLCCLVIDNGYHLPA